MFVLLFVFAEDFSGGFSRGLACCAETVIPSMFPFLAAASLAGAGELPPRIKRIAEPAARRLFKLPAEGLTAVIIGLFGGYLSGAKAAQALYSSGRITQGQAQRAAMFCISPGIGFSITAVGGVMLGSREAGKIVLISVSLAAVILGAVCGLFPDNSEKSAPILREKTVFSRAVVSGVSSSASAMLTACAFIAFFSGITAVIDKRVSSESAGALISCLLEITGGCASVAGRASLPLICAACAFGGVCVHLQIFAVVGKVGIKILPFYICRILHALLSFAICAFIIKLFPMSESVFLPISKNAALWSFSAPASVSLLLLSALLILDLDNGKKIC